MLLILSQLSWPRRVQNRRAEDVCPTQTSAASDCITKTSGKGLPLLLLPGALGTGQSDFAPQLQALPQRGIRVVVPDPRGYGKSRPPEREFPPDFYQQDVHDFAALMETLGCSTYAVGGWSDGAIASLLLTLAYPQRVTRMAAWGGNAYVTQEDIDVYETTRNVVGLGAARGSADAGNVRRRLPGPVDALV